MSTQGDQAADPELLRNRAGTARERDPAEPLEELDLEEAIARNVRMQRQQQPGQPHLQPPHGKLAPSSASLELNPRY